jgi:hypothetical protein
METRQVDAVDIDRSQAAVGEMVEDLAAQLQDCHGMFKNHVAVF